MILACWNWSALDKRAPPGIICQREMGEGWCLLKLQAAFAKQGFSSWVSPSCGPGCRGGPFGRPCRQRASCGIYSKPQRVKAVSGPAYGAAMHICDTKSTVPLPSVHARSPLHIRRASELWRKILLLRSLNLLVAASKFSKCGLLAIEHDVEAGQMRTTLAQRDTLGIMDIRCTAVAPGL